MKLCVLGVAFSNVYASYLACFESVLVEIIIFQGVFIIVLII